MTFTTVIYFIDFVHSQGALEIGEICAGEVVSQKHKHSVLTATSALTRCLCLGPSVLNGFACFNKKKQDYLLINEIINRR